MKNGAIAILLLILILALGCKTVPQTTGEVITDAHAQTSKSTRKIVLPNPHLIHCHTAQCSQLWKEDSPDGGVTYPAQIFTDLVNGSVNGLTAVYDKSVSMEEVRAAINERYGNSAVAIVDGVWRVEQEQLAISVTKQSDETTQLTYLQFGARQPSAHIDVTYAVSVTAVMREHLSTIVIAALVLVAFGLVLGRIGRRFTQR
jgi:hypothetical protein